MEGILAVNKQENKWTRENIPDLAGKVAVITGASSGIGFAATQALAYKGVHVVMGCRNLHKGTEAIVKIEEKIPNASVELIELDLADLSSVRNFAAKFKRKHELLDILLNNAGIMGTPKLKTVDGFELQFGTNFLGHFALTGLIIDRLMLAKGSRVVTMSSSEHKCGRINFNDLQSNQSYSRFGAYAQSKLANILFAYELHRRLRAAGSSTLSLCSHPGGARTNLWSGLGKTEDRVFFRRIIAKIKMVGVVSSRGMVYFDYYLRGQTPEYGALPMLYAATSLDAESGAYYGPDGKDERTGFPKKVQSSEASYDIEVAKRLWEVASELTGVKFNI